MQHIRLEQPNCIRSRGQLVAVDFCSRQKTSAIQTAASSPSRTRAFLANLEHVMAPVHRLLHYACVALGLGFGLTAAGPISARDSTAMIATCMGTNGEQSDVGA